GEVQMALSRRKLLASAAMAAGSFALRDDIRAQGIPPIPGFGTPRDEPIFGFDCRSYPGPDAIMALRDRHRFRVCCLYLAHCPNYPDESWLTQREFLRLHGWGFLPTYVGAQTQGPCTMEISDPDGMGRSHGNEAAELMNRAGFPTGAVVYLDIEDPNLENAQYWKYVRAWMKAIHDQHYYPGAYGSYLAVDLMRELTSAIWTFELSENVRAVEADLKALSRENPQIKGEQTSWGSSVLEQLFKMKKLGYDRSKFPQGRIRRGCIATQYIQRQKFLDVVVPKGVDFDCSFLKASDPSDPASIAQALNIPRLI
ncbi:MAG: glycoside hydrolase domain-containing protein, partial [Opitutaceae bacterium]